MRTKVTLSLIAALVLSLGGSSAVFANDDSSPSPSASVTASASAKPSESIRQCSKITKAITARTKHFDKNKDKHYTKYKAIRARLAKVVTKAKANGQDTAALEADLVVLDQKIAKFATDYAAYIAILKETKTYTCGRSEGEFKSKVEDARTQLKVVKADAEDIKDYIKNTIKPELQKLKKASDDSEATASPSASPSPSPSETESSDDSQNN